MDKQAQLKKFKLRYLLLFFLIFISSSSLILSQEQNQDTITITTKQAIPNFLTNVKTETNGGNLTAKYNNKNITINPLFVYNNENYTFGEAKQLVPSLTFSQQLITVEDYYKWIPQIDGIPANLRGKFNITLNLVDANGITWEDVEKKGSTIVLFDKIRLDFSDLLSNFSVKILNKKSVLIYDINCTSCVFDPKIKSNEISDISVDKEGVKIFNITTNVKAHAVGNIDVTKEWGYDDAGYEIIKSPKKLEILDSYYICIKNKTTERDLSVSKGVRVWGYANPECIEYKPYLFNNTNKSGIEGQDFIDVVTRELIDNYTAKVTWSEGGYDPTGVNYTGDCNSVCYITTNEYNFTLREGTGTHFYKNSVEPDFNWGTAATSGNNALGSLQTSVIEMSPGTTGTTCVETNFTDTVNIYCSEASGFSSYNNWTFNKTYIKLSSMVDTTYSVRHNVHVEDDANDLVWNGTISRNEAAWTDWDSNTGTSAISYSSGTNHTLVIIWDEGIITDFDHGFDPEPYGGLIIGYSRQITGNVWIEQYLKILPRNESASGDAQYTDMQSCFKANILCNDTVVAADTTKPSITIAPQNISQDNQSIFWNVTLSENSNITGAYAVAPSCSGVGTFTNSTKSTYFEFNITSLINSTTYCFNITSMCDTSNNCNTSGYNFSFITAQTTVAADSCSCPASGDFEIINGDQCTLATVCDVTPNSFRVLDGAMRIQANGFLRADGCYIQDNENFYVDDSGGFYCG